MLSRGSSRRPGWIVEHAVMTRAQSDAPEAFGEVLRRFRAAAGVSQESLAARAGLSAHRISDLEQGARRNPYPDTVRRLSEALNLAQVERVALHARGSPLQGIRFADT